MTPPTEVPRIPCICCGHILDARWQASLYVEMSPYWLITCQNPNCDGLYGYTFSSNNYPPENIERYLSKGEIQYG